ncbi:MAG: DNA-3-methyladenine glycosylase [Bacillota bacterium]|nr:DNA-3-methyladenine glycosylase [Bacillota bacterium]
MRLTEEYYLQSAKVLAKDLLGKVLCVRNNKEIMKLRITETECYFSESDTACHAHKGKTERTKILYKKGGRAYVYLCYGMYNLFNVVTGEEDLPQAVLIRGVEGYDGPGKLAKAMGIDRRFNDADLTTSEDIWIEDWGEKKPKFKRDKRVGIGYASEKDQERLWRYIVIE